MDDITIWYKHLYGIYYKHLYGIYYGIEGKKTDIRERRYFIAVRSSNQVPDTIQPYLWIISTPVSIYLAHNW